MPAVLIIFVPQTKQALFRQDTSVLLMFWTGGELHNKEHTDVFGVSQNFNTLAWIQQGTNGNQKGLNTVPFMQDLSSICTVLSILY